MSSSRISCRRAGAELRQVVCDLSLSVQEISPTGRVSDRFIPHCTGQVLLDGGAGYLGDGFQCFSVRPDELRTRPTDHKKVVKWYMNHTGLDGRYRVLEVIDGTGPGMVRGSTIYRETSDFAHFPSTRYQYSPYLFEALMQLVGFYMVTTDPSERRPVLPVEIGEMQYVRQCRAGERIALEARLLARDKASLVWDARGLDDLGRTIMQIRAMRMQWVSE